MNATGLLVILVGMFVLLNANKIVGVVQGNTQFNFVKPAAPSGSSSNNSSQPPTNQFVGGSNNA